MKTFTITQARRRLADVLSSVAAGERVAITRRGEMVFRSSGRVATRVRDEKTVRRAVDAMLRDMPTAVRRGQASAVEEFEQMRSTV